jgi:serine/threonine protein kinase
MDLKLENILLNPVENKIKIIDFGNSCFFKKGNVTIYNRGMKGTEHYMSPEMWSQKAYMADKADVWACGILLYNFIYNRVPWEKANELDNIYCNFKTNMENNILCNRTFEHPSLYGYSYDDSCIILDLFYMMFNLNYYHRCDIEDVYKKLLKITLE